MSNSSKYHEKLIKRVKSGDIDAFDMLMLEFGSSIRSFIAYHLPVKECIEEVSQRTFIYAFENIDNFKKGSIKSWLITIARNQTLAEIEQFKRIERNKEKYSDHLSALEVTLHPEKISERQFHLDHCLDQLKPEHFELIKLSYQEGYKAPEISKFLNKSHAWVRTSLMRVRNSLRQCIESQVAE